MVLIALLLVGCKSAAPTEPAAKQAVDGFTAPPDARVWYLKSVAAEVSGDLAEAKRSLEWVTRLDRRSPWPWMARGRLAEVAEDPETAWSAYQKAWEKAPIPEAWEALTRMSATTCRRDALVAWAAERGIAQEVPADDPGCATGGP